jgi:hypothetical protein
VIQNRALTKVQKELVHALESARNQLAVAIAAESKSTLPDQWRCYLDTADRMCRFIKRLRKTGMAGRSMHADWIHALEGLRKLSAQDKARRLCRILDDIVAELERVLHFSEA